jgi:hypothetical protein
MDLVRGNYGMMVLVLAISTCYIYSTESGTTHMKPGMILSFSKYSC